MRRQSRDAGVAVVVGGGGVVGVKQLGGQRSTIGAEAEVTSSR